MFKIIFYVKLEKNKFWNLRYILFFHINNRFLFKNLMLINLEKLEI